MSQDMKFYQQNEHKSKTSESLKFVVSKLEGGCIKEGTTKLFLNAHFGVTPNKGMTFDADDIVPVVKVLLGCEQYFTKEDLVDIANLIMEVKNRK